MCLLLNTKVKAYKMCFKWINVFMLPFHHTHACFSKVGVKKVPKPTLKNI